MTDGHDEIYIGRGHDWGFAGYDYGEIRVAIYYCRVCGIGFQRADADHPDTPEDERDWTAWSPAGSFDWEEIKPVPDCGEAPVTTISN